MLIDIDAIRLLTPMYSDKNRHYHDINHIYYIFSKLEQHYGVLSHKIKTTLPYTIWFHDAIYSPYPNNNNEIESAELYKAHYYQHLLDIHTNEIMLTIMQGIIATKYHLLNEEQLSRELKIAGFGEIEPSTYMMLDLDLISFTENQSMVDYNSENVLKEYQALGLPREELLKGRLKFLTNLLNKDKIYYTLPHLENIARARINDSINSVKLELQIS